MLKYCAKKIAQLLIVLVLISFFSFGIIYFAPGDVSSMYITQDMTDEQKEQVRKDLGLDRSMMEQYTEWAKRAVQGDFGVSLANKNSVKRKRYRLPFLTARLKLPRISPAK